MAKKTAKAPKYRPTMSVAGTEEMQDLNKLSKARYTSKAAFNKEATRFDASMDKASAPRTKMTSGQRQSDNLNKMFGGQRPSADSIRNTNSMKGMTMRGPINSTMDKAMEGFDSPRQRPSKASAPSPQKALPAPRKMEALTHVKEAPKAPSVAPRGPSAPSVGAGNRAMSTASKVGKLGKIAGRFAGPVGIAAGLALTAKDIYDESQTGDIAKYAAGAGGSLAKAFKYNPRDPTQARPATSPVAKRELGYGPSQQVSDSGFQSGQKALADAKAGNQGNDNYPTVRGSSGRSEFETAFRAARDKSGGPEGSFNFKGKEYSTAYKEETSAAGRVIASPSLPIPDFIPKKKKA